MREDLPREEAVGTIDRAVEELLQAAGINAPPVDAIALAQRHLGMVVCLDRRQPQRGRAQRSAGKPQIYLRPEPIEERHQWTVAHEIGEHLKPALLHRLGGHKGNVNDVATNPTARPAHAGGCQWSRSLPVRSHNRCDDPAMAVGPRFY